MKKLSVLFFLLLCSVFVFAQDESGVPADGYAAGNEAASETDGGSSDPYQFIVYSETKDNAQIDLAFNELTGVLRVTYTSVFSPNEGDVLISIRDSVSAFARSKGYLKFRVYPDEDSISYRDNGRTMVFKRFYILYEKSGF